MKKMGTALKNLTRANLRPDQVDTLKSVRNAVNRRLDPVRRMANYLRVKALYATGLRSGHHVKLHLGCGAHGRKGYINVDWRKTPATDLVLDVRRLPYPDGIASVIECYHAIEHFPRNEVLSVLKEWHRVLMPGGKLVLEYPDFDKEVSKYLEGDVRQLDGVFGHQRFAGDIHYFGYNQERMATLLRQAGFAAIEAVPPNDYHISAWDCLRTEAVKFDGDSTILDQLPEELLVAADGERVIEGMTEPRIWLDHHERYRFAAAMSSKRCVLDVSCGTGYGSRMLSDAGAGTTVGVDLDATTVRLAQHRYATESLRFAAGDLLRLPFPDNAFDLITCFETIEHVDGPEEGLKELARVLAPGGTLLISTPDRRLTSPGKNLGDQPDNRHHVREYTAQEFKQLLRPRFHVEKMFGQRGIGRFWLQPLVRQLLRKRIGRIYAPSRGNAVPQHCSHKDIYRYVIAVVRPRGNDRHDAAKESPVTAPGSTTAP